VDDENNGDDVPNVTAGFDIAPPPLFSFLSSCPNLSSASPGPLRLQWALKVFQMKYGSKRSRMKSSSAKTKLVNQPTDSLLRRRQLYSVQATL
jgi:hypothetical protein